MELVLKYYPGLESTDGSSRSVNLFIVDNLQKDHSVNYLRGNPRREQQLRQNSTWLPDFQWFIRED
ncbi:hypothetical protein L917_16125 [Phytophthora nicotianae]|uniref:Uncharacterized protein n=1 Tax=Phytophthora nicotianae TaxID=4792 RepID=W2MLE3_PHYNI|nr:hypothetical protein L916_16313 [Phytophthora nicotianae]ETL83992.1 hypothetical protein L917_16125 [Phytophthora nicotianae]ETM37187.1 hypothetical protein L914_16239 [Phytophthora nicotianae]